LFFTEMWERFSYYGMRALLVLYLVNALGYQRGDALAVYGTYTALVYLTPIAGGYLAISRLPQAILIGAGHGVGHFAMAFPVLLMPARADRRRQRYWPTSPRCSARSTASTTRGATAASPSSTWASTWARS
jgi:dipeptide/tripeptide permease